MRRQAKNFGQTIDYELIQTNRKNIEFRALPEGVRVFAPKGMKLKEIDRLVLERADWIAEAIRRLEGYRDTRRARFSFEDGMPVPVEGREYALAVRQADKPRVYFEGERVIVETPDSSPENVEQRLRAFLIELAGQRIEERLGYFVPIVGRTPNRITIREQKTRWGSCSNIHNLNFNWQLIMAPPEALDYVVVHELCHLYELNHSDAFWRRVRRHMPEFETWRRFLRSGWSRPFAP